MSGPQTKDRDPAFAIERRSLLGGLAGVVGAALTGRADARRARRDAAGSIRVPASAAAEARVILLGTKGGPTPSPDRAPPSTALVIGGNTYVIDCGNGVANQLAKAGIGLPTVTDIFITHNHSDHVIDVATLLVLAWASGLKTPVQVFGPPPLEEIVKSGLEASRYDIEIRMREEGRPPLAPLITVRESDSPGVVMRTDDMVVTRALVDHYTVRPAFAYRFDTRDRSIVISGDTAPCEALVALAKDADVLVHEALYAPMIESLMRGNAPALREHLLRSHTTTEQLGIVAARAGVRKLVLTHLVPGDGVSDADWIAGVRKNYAGPIVVGRDLMEV